METYKFGGQPQSTLYRPPCWGRSYEDGNRECRSCPVQGSCRDEIVRMNVNRPMYNPNPYQPYLPPSPFTQQQQHVQAPVPVPTYQPPSGISGIRRIAPMTGAPTQQPVQMPMPAVQPTSVPYGYGWMQDPMHYYVHTMPPPLRTQMPGESFSQRMVKNIGLAMLESIFASMFLAVRQMVWEPQLDQRIVDVGPLPPPQAPPNPPQP